MSNTLIINELARPGVTKRRRQGSKYPAKVKSQGSARDGQQGQANTLFHLKCGGTRHKVQKYDA